MLLVPLVISLLLVWILSRWALQRNRPPGPWNLPIVGYLPWLDSLAPYLTLTRLSRHYGPIYGLYMGTIYTVVLSDARLIRRAFNRAEASGRAPLYLTHGIMKGYGLICAQGELWKDQRKFVHNFLRTIGASRVSQNRTKMHTLITTHVLDLVQQYKNLGEKIILDPLETLQHSLGSIINVIVFGKLWSKDDPTWKWLQHLQEEGTKHIGVSGPLNFLPFLIYLPKYRKVIEYLLNGKKESHRFYHTLIQEEEANYKGGEPENLIQAFLVERSKREDWEKFYNDEQFHHLLADIFGASLDTTLSSIRWLLLYLAAHRDVQLRLKTHIVEVVGSRTLTLEDLPNLPYLEACIAEVLRVRPVVPVGIPHGTLEELEMEGYILPKGTMIIPLQWAVHRDPQIWEEPESFNPDRFIDEEGRFFKPEAFIPFQTGKRMCIGDELAKMFLSVFGATLVQNFEITLEEGSKVDLDGVCGITLTPKAHKLVFTSY